MNSKAEQWKPIIGWAGYWVSDQGRVKGSSGKVLKGTTNPGRGDYLYVNLSAGSYRRRIKISVLVLEAFVGPRPDNFDACHNDGNAANDMLTNLRWDTKRNNQLDIVKHGRHHEANKTHCPAGHELSGENLVASKLPKRICRVCMRQREHVRRNDELKG